MYEVDYPVNRFDEVSPNLWIGGHVMRGKYGGPRSVEVRREDGFDHVFSLYIDRHSRLPGNVKVHTIGEINDGMYPSPREEQIIEYLADNVVFSTGGGWKVLVRCQAGYNRSGIVIARALMRMGDTAADAIAAVRKARGSDALCNPHFVKYLEQRQVEAERMNAILLEAYKSYSDDEERPVRRGRPIRRGDLEIANFPGQMEIEDVIGPIEPKEMPDVQQE